MKVFLDTNVLLDWILARDHAYGKEAEEIILLAEKKTLEAYVSSGTIYTLAYFIEKAGIKENDLKETMLKVLKIVEVLPNTTQMFVTACSLSFKDLEDAFQYQTALTLPKISLFITGNERDFNPYFEKKLPIINPANFLKLLS